MMMIVFQCGSSGQCVYIYYITILCNHHPNDLRICSQAPVISQHIAIFFLSLFSDNYKPRNRSVLSWLFYRYIGVYSIYIGKTPCYIYTVYFTFFSLSLSGEVAHRPQLAGMDSLFSLSHLGSPSTNDDDYDEEEENFFSLSLSLPCLVRGG